jgi:hypothetical protein
MKINLLVAFVTIAFFASCSKDCPDPQTNQSVEQLLTSKTWKIDELRVQFSDNTSSYYKRGGIVRGVSYDSDSLKFSLNNTGTYYYGGNIYTTSWTFVNSTKDKMTITVNRPTPETINLENVQVTSTFFRCSQYNVPSLFVQYLASVTRVPN